MTMLLTHRNKKSQNNNSPANKDIAVSALGLPDPIPLLAAHDNSGFTRLVSPRNGEASSQANTSMPDFAIAEPTPHVSRMID